MSELPPNWTLTTFGAINRFRSSTINPADFPDEEFELYSVPSFPSKQPEIVSGSTIGSTKQLVQPNDVLVCKINPRINRVWIVGPSSGRRQIASSEWIVHRSSEVNAGYLRHYFSSAPFRELICDGVTGVGGSLTRAQPKRVATFPIPIAPSAEQKRIADKLDRLLAAVDTCKARLDAIPGILKRFRQSVLAAAVSGDLTEEWRVATKQPKEWKQVALSEVAQVIDPNPSHRYPSYEEGAVPIVATEQFMGREDYDLSRAKLVDEVFYEARRRAHGFLQHDIVFARKGRLGLARRMPRVEKFVFSHTVFIVRSNEPSTSSYLMWHLRSEACIDWLLQTMNSNTGVPTLGKAVMQRLPINLPPPAEQRQIVSRIERLFSIADEIETRVDTVRSRVSAFSSQILYKAFRGELSQGCDLPMGESDFEGATNKSSAVA